MAIHIKKLSRRAKSIYGWGCIAIGSYPIALAFGLLSAERAGLSAPPWVVGAAGLSFVIAGTMILLANYSRANDLLAAILLFIFGAIGVWVSLFSSDEGFSGGVLFASREQNILIGRWVFGIGALISFSMCAYAIRRATSSSTRES